MALLHSSQKVPLWKLLVPKTSVQKDFVRTSKISKRRKDDQKMHAPHLVFKAPESTPTHRALAYFDDHYGKVLGRRWPSVRLALFTQPKHCALVNNFAPVEETRLLLMEQGCVSLRDAVRDEMDANYQEISEPPPLPDMPERPQRDRVEEAYALTPEIFKKDVSMPLDDETTRGRLIRPSEQILRGQNDSAALHDFVPTKAIKGMDDFVEEEAYYESYQKLSGVAVSKVIDRAISYPEHLDAFVFPSSDVSRFPQPKKSILETYNYYCMDLASLLPVIALGVKPHDAVLDMCSAPGGKSLAILQTLRPASLVCNDKSHSRMKRVMDVMDMYLKDVGSEIKRTIQFMNWSGLELPFLHGGKYDKILCDVPCFTDRHILNEDESNIFAVHRKKRTNIATTIANRFACPGGTVVYSTCSLSPMQNDGVVHGALRKLWEETDIEFYVNDLSSAFAPFKSFLNLVNEECSVKYGQLVLPHIANNFGPMYFSKITRTR